MGKLHEFSLKTEQTGVYNITRTVIDTVRESGIENGIAVIYCPHTTAGITLNENTDTNVGLDLLLGIWQNVYFVEFDGPRERKYYIKLVEC